MYADAKLKVEARVARGAYGLYRLEMRHDLLTADEEIALARKIRAGDLGARNLLITKNLRLVADLARQYNFLAMPIDDLIQEGNIGLTRAAEKFDPAFGTRFSTYATYWIRQSILMALSKNRFIRIPDEVRRDIKRLQEFEQKCIEETGTLPSEKDVMNGLGISRERVGLICNGETLVASMDASFSDEDNDSSLHDTLSIPSHEDGVLDAADLKYRVSKVLELLNHKGIPKKLQPILHEVVSRAYGLDGSPPQRVEEIARAMEIKYSLTKSYLRRAKHWMANKASTLEWAS